MYARGILFGKMKYELGDHSFVRCPELGLMADIEFKTKGWVGGTYNAIVGTIKNEHTGDALFEISGLWSEEMYIKDLKVKMACPQASTDLLTSQKTGRRDMFFNALRSKPSPPLTRPMEEQEEGESQRLWAKTTQAIKDRNHEAATDEKTKVEDMQRDEAAKRVNDGVEWHPRLFRPVKGGPGGSEEAEEDLEWIINADMYVRVCTGCTSRVCLAGADDLQRRDMSGKAGRTDTFDLSCRARSEAKPTDQHHAAGLTSSIWQRREARQRRGSQERRVD